jgi:effector-binding domain-containing protein
MADPTPPHDPAIIDLAPQATAAVRVQQPFGDDLAPLFDRYPQLILDRLTELGTGIGGPPFARYHEFGPERVDVEIGFPVPAPVKALPSLADCPPGEVGSSELPGGPTAVTTHRGAYDGLSKTYDRLHDWIHAEGRDDGPGPWESYVDSPTEVADPTQLRTTVFWPISGG